MLKSNLSNFIENSEREFDERFIFSDIFDDSRGFCKQVQNEVKDFHSQKLREFVGELKKEVEGLKREKSELYPERPGDKEAFIWNNACDKFLDLLNEVLKDNK